MTTTKSLSSRWSLRIQTVAEINAILRFARELFSDSFWPASPALLDAGDSYT